MHSRFLQIVFCIVFYNHEYIGTEWLLSVKLNYITFYETVTIFCKKKYFIKRESYMHNTI